MRTCVPSLKENIARKLTFGVVTAQYFCSLEISQSKTCGICCSLFFWGGGGLPILRILQAEFLGVPGNRPMPRGTCILLTRMLHGCLRPLLAAVSVQKASWHGTFWELQSCCPFGSIEGTTTLRNHFASLLFLYINKVYRPKRAMQPSR